MPKKLKKQVSLIVVALLVILSLAGCGAKTEPDKETQPSNDAQSSEQTQINVQTISINELEKNLDNTDYVIVDLRKDEAYNGWEIDGISRGGHIKNAIQFSVNWLSELKDKSLEELLTEKGIASDKTVVLYHSDNDKIDEMAKQLSALNYKDVYKFENLKEWADNKDLPMEILPNYQLVVYPQWVNALIKGENPETYAGKDYVILETSWGSVSEAYNAGHIPGAFHFNTDNIESDPEWNFGPNDKVKDSLEAFGITPDTTVVIYSEDVSAAAREVQGLLWAGVKDVRLLNGGLKAWKDAGFEIETKENKPTAIKDFGLTVPQRPEYVVALPKDVMEKQKDPNYRLVSIRSWKEFIGETSGYDYIKEAGEPKGAVWGHAGSDPYHMEEYIDVDGTLRSPYEIEKLWAEWDITKDNEVSFYCGTGWRASVAWITAYTLGWENISVYDGGWHVWAMDENNPVQKGDPRSK